MLAAITLAACENDDTDFSKEIAEPLADSTEETDGDTNEETSEEEEEPEPGSDAKQIAFDYTALEEAAEEFASDDGDYVENRSFAGTLYIEYNGSSVNITGDTDLVGVVTDGAHVTVNASKKMEYVLSGSSDNGSLKIEDTETFMKVTLNGLNLTNPTGAAINDQSGKSFYIVLADGTENTLTDGSTYTMVTGEDMKGTIFSEGQIIFSGSGSLNVYAYGKNGIASDDYIVFRPGNVINVYSYASNGVKANDGVFIRGGVLNIEVSADGAKGINSETNLDVTGGRTTIITSGGIVVEDADTKSCAGVKTDFWMLMEGGELNIKSTGEGGKGINCTTDITFNGGTLNVVTLGAKGDASPKGIKADGLIEITGGYVYSYSLYSSAIEAATGLYYSEENLLNNDTGLFEISY